MTEETNKASGADDSPLLAVTVAANMIRDRCPCPTSCDDCEISRALRDARAAVSDLIAERDALLEKVKLLAKWFPTDDDLAMAGWHANDIAEACDSYESATAIIAKCENK